MTKRSVRWAIDAEQDLEHLIDFLLSRSLDAGESTWRRIRAAATKLESLSERGRKVPELVSAGVHGYRELIVSRRFRIVYRATRRSVLVVAVFDGRRDLEDVLLGRFGAA